MVKRITKMLHKLLKMTKYFYDVMTNNRISGVRIL